MGEAEKERISKFLDVTPIGYARRFQEPQFVNALRLALVAERGGTD